MIDKVLDFNFLGIHFNEQLNWNSHINKWSIKCGTILGISNRLNIILPLKIKSILYNSLMLPHLNYDITLWCFKCEIILKLQQQQTVLRYTLPRTINNTPTILPNRIYMHSLHGSGTYIKNVFIQTYNIVPCTIIL